MENNKNRTVAGTDIDEVKRQIAGGASNGSTAGAFSSTTDAQKVREEIAQEGGPFGKPAANQSFGNQSTAGQTASGTDIQQVREEIAQEAGPFGKTASKQSMGNQTVAGTDIDEVKRQNAGSNQNYNQ